MGVVRSGAKAVFAFADLFGPTPGGPRVLIYHQVGSALGRQIEVSEKGFIKQIDWLEANYEVVDLDAAVTRWVEPESSRLAVLTFDDGYLDTYQVAFPLLKERGLPFVVYVATSSIENDRPHGPPGTDPLRWAHLEEMIDTGLVTVGAHTHTHPDMRRLTPEETDMELTESNRLINDRLGVSPRHFAYPYGYWAPAAESAVSRVYATAVIGATPEPPVQPDPHRLHRYPVQSSDGFVFFKSRLRGGLRLEETVRRRLRGYEGP